MGREIRRVPPNWEHPKRQMWRPTKGYVDEYHPLYDEAFAPKMREWIAEWDKWERGERPDYCSEESAKLPYWEWAGGPPDPQYHRPDWKDEEMTWWQVYETVSEGTPVTPPFATPEALVDYLATHGDFWDQSRGDGAWSRENAEAFVKRGGWAPSMVVVDGVVHMPRDGMPS
jgi:hypothetical protein